MLARQLGSKLRLQRLRQLWLWKEQGGGRASRTCKNEGDTTPQLTAMESSGNILLIGSVENAGVDQRCSMRAEEPVFGTET